MAKTLQLDLFGAMMAEHVVETKPIVDATPIAEEFVAVQEPTFEFIETESLQEPSVEIVKPPLTIYESNVNFLVVEPLAIEEVQQATTIITSEPSFTFEDEKINIKVKSTYKTFLNHSLPTKSKRGRKSFKEMDAEVDLIEVPDDEALSKKLYYSISEVASWFKVNTSLIRAWSTQFDIIQPRKNRKGDRLFRAEDVKNLQIIYYLLRSRKFSVDGAKKYLKSNKKQVDTNLTLIQSLTKFRSFLLEMKTNLEA